MAVQIAFLIRYSYVGRSGWRSAASQDPEKLLNPDRLAARMALFRNITVPSLVAQTDQDFHVFVLAAKATPQKYKIRLRRLLRQRIGGGRCHVMFKPPGGVRKPFLQALRAVFAPEDHIAQVVLDDDDAVATDFTAGLRARSQELCANLKEPRDYHFVSFPKGLSMVMQSEAPQLFHRNVPGINLGLTLLAQTGFHKTPFCCAHNKVPARHPCLIVEDPGPWFVRTIHSSNDSRANFSPSQLNAQERRFAEAKFPWLSSRRKALAGLCQATEVGTKHPLPETAWGPPKASVHDGTPTFFNKIARPHKLQDSQIDSNLT